MQAPSRTQRHNTVILHPEKPEHAQNMDFGAQYEAKRTSPEQNQHRRAEYEAKLTSPEENQQSGAQ